MNTQSRLSKYILMRTLAVCVVLSVLLPCKAAEVDSLVSHNAKDSIAVAEQESFVAMDDSVAKIISAVDSANLNSTKDSLSKRPKVKRDWSTWRPSAKRAMWLAIVIPGAGQIYNRKYWKLPIVYGGFLGCLYAIRWNNQMYHDYSQAYMDIMDNDPTTQSYNQFLHLGVTIDEANKEYYQELFRKRKDRYRRWRDMSVFVMIGIYALSVIDAYVDASLSEFDISDDLSFSVEPTVINDQQSRNPIKSSALGVQCAFTF